jgi:uncharacterized protein YndB with AHSA1/START domain
MQAKTYAITIRKVFSTTVDALWETWKEPALYQIIHTVYRSEIDFRVGGSNKVQFYPDKEVGETLVYLEIIPKKKLVFAWQGEESNPATVTFSAQGQLTEVAITQECQDNPEWFSNGLDGWAWILDSTAEFLATGNGLTNETWRTKFDTYKIHKNLPPAVKP